MKNTTDSIITLEPGLKESNAGGKQEAEPESIHWEIEVSGFRITSPGGRKPRESGLESMIELYSGDQTIVGTLKFYRDAESLTANCLSMGCVYGHFHENLFQHFVDILRSMENLRLYYFGEQAEGGRAYLQPSEAAFVRSTTEDAD